MALFKSALPLVGLDIGTNTFRVVQIKAASPKPLLAAYGSIRLPVGAVVEGELVDVEAAAPSLKNLWKKVGLREKRVVIGVANQKVIIRPVELPFMEREELRGTLQYQAQEYIPIPVEEAILDFQVLRDFKGDSGERMVEVLLVAAQKEMIRNIVLAAEKGGLKPAAIDVSSFALTRALLPELSLIPEEKELEKLKEPVALINIGAGVTNIVIAEEGVPRFVRITPLAGGSFTQAVAEALSLSLDEAEEFKIKVGLPPPRAEKSPGIPKKEEERVSKTHKVLEKEATKLATEIHRSFDYFLAQAPKAKGISRIILSGGGGKLKNLISFLENELELAIEIGRPLGKVKIGGGLSAEELRQEEASLAIPLGLALRGLEK